MTRAVRPSENDPARLKWSDHQLLWAAVEGAVVDAFKNHPEYLTDAGRAAAVRSVTKRVVGAVVAHARETREGGGFGRCLGDAARDRIVSRAVWPAAEAADASSSAGGDKAGGRCSAPRLTPPLPALALGLAVSFGLACVAGSAWAQDRVAWGRLPQFTVQLVPGRMCPIEVWAQNRLTGGLMSPTMAMLHLGEIAVGVRVDHGGGDIPDVLTVTPPDGWIAEPPTLTLEEDESGIVEICMAAGV